LSIFEQKEVIKSTARRRVVKSYFRRAQLKRVGLIAVFEADAAFVYTSKLA